MKKLAIVILIASSAGAWAQNQKPVAGSGARVDNCAPIGRTEDGKLVYSMKCDNIPKPLKPVAEKDTTPVETPVAEAPEEENKGGMFRFPFGSSIGVTNYKRQQGVGPASSQ